MKHLSKWRYLAIPPIAILMAILGWHLINLVYDPKLNLNIYWLCAASTLLWLIFGVFLKEHSFWRALLLGGISPFVGSLLIIPHWLSPLIVSGWSAVAVPTGIATGVVCWILLNYRFQKTEQDAAANP